MTRIYDIFNDEDTLVDYLDLTNFSWKGVFSEVYDLSHLTEDKVLKVTEDAPYLEYLKFILANQELSAVPKGYDVEIINGCYYILMEKLELTELYCASRAEQHGWYEYDPCVWKGESVSLDIVFDKLEQIYESNLEPTFVWDLRDTNIMQRRDGSLVVIDPWSDVAY